jgi:DNA repair protein RecN (Recombination protein N)
LIASGGEVSRIMLALKEIFNTSDKDKTLIFDEIDTGISGQTANKVSLKLKKLSKSNQLIVITHLPVVAAKADKHFNIFKHNENGTTKTKISVLGKDDAIQTIAKMISGEITDKSVSNAIELMETNNA